MSSGPYKVQVGDSLYEIEVLAYEPGQADKQSDLRVRIDKAELAVQVSRPAEDQVRIDFPNGQQLVHILKIGNEWQASVSGLHVTLEQQIGRSKTGLRQLPREVTPPMPAVVVRVLVAVGDEVKQGQALVVVSAMKMETTLVAKFSGR
ncbi:MAG: biotin/lipoyl-binding protein, partial [Deltaproteobacteria bacterium]|nr:biotin/lipoyl-binding protein [Deltaproteobacteria bacterium]